MKKLLFISLLLCSHVSFSVQAGVRPVTNQETAAAVANESSADYTIPDPIDRFDNESDFKKYLIERLRTAVIMQHDKNSGSYGGAATSTLKDELPDEYKEKTFYEQVYEDAIKRATAKPDNTSQQLDPEMLQPELWENKNSSQPLNSIAVNLPPYDEKVMVPPYEHIPYLFSRIEVLPNGLLKIDETITVISNAQKLRYPLSKALPTHMVDREGKSHKIEVNINEVTVNGYPLDYKIIEKGGNIVITPSANIPLDAGVYTDVFSYIVDRQIAYYDKFDELNWNVSGGNWNLVISRIGASVVLPQGSETITQRVLVGYPFHYSHERALMTREAPNIIGFSSKVPLFIAENMPITVVLPKGVAQEPDFAKKMDFMLLEYGTIIIPLLGFLTIVISYILSWRYIKKNSKKLPIKLARSPQMLRVLISGDFDNRAFGAFILDMFRKNIIDIQKSDKQVMLVKRTDNLKSLNKKERQALRIMFAKESVLTISTSSIPKLKKAMVAIKENTISKFNTFTLKLSALYVIFGCGMLLFTELFTAYSMMDAGKKFSIMLSVTIGILFYLVLFNIKWKKIWMNILIKLLAILMIMFNFVILAGVCTLWGALLILASCIAIIFFNNLYRQRNGLVKANIAEAVQLQKHLTQNSESIALSRDFINHQANIFAVEAENIYPQNDANKEVYRLDIIKAIISKI